MAQQPGRSPAKYRQIVTDLLDRIEAGECPVGSQLPTKPEMGKHYDAAPGTIDHALAELRQMGMIESKQGVGTFVIRQRREVTEQGDGPLERQIHQLTDRVESLELNLRDLYGKQGFDYPREDAAKDEGSPSRAVGT